jgi:hypothetical protein
VKGFVRKPPGTAIEQAVISARAEEAEHDLEAVVTWIESHGGRLVKPPLFRHTVIELFGSN